MQVLLSRTYSVSEGELIAVRHVTALQDGITSANVNTAEIYGLHLSIWEPHAP
jgi:hypothetical protein